MTSTRLPRRALLGAVLAASLATAGLTAIAAEAPCTTFTDPAGDSRPADVPGAPEQSGEPTLDLTGVTFETVGTDLSVSLYVSKLNAAPEYSLGDAFKAFFTHGGKAVELYAYRYNPTDIGDAASVLYDQSGMDVNGDAATTTMKVTYDAKANRVGFLLPLADLEKATKAPTAGASLSALSAEAAGDNLLFAEPWDTATAAKDLTYAVGSACGGKAAPVPAKPAAPSPAPSSSPSPAPSSSATPTAGIAAAGLPAADCYLAKDAKGDSTIRVVTTGPGTPNDPDLDLLGITFGTSGDNLIAAAKVDKLGAGPTQGTDGHRFTFYFTHNKNVFAMAGSAYKNAAHGQIRDGAASTGQFSHVTQLSVNAPGLTDPNSRIAPGFVESGLKFTFDQKNSFVIATLPLKDIEKYGKAPTAGATFTGVYGISAADTDLISSQADVVPDGATASAPGKATYTVGDNKCFAPPVSPLTSLGSTKAQYGDLAAVSARLVDAAGKPVAGKDVTFALGSSKATGRTNAGGVAKASLLVKEKAGKRTLTLTSGDASTTVPFTVLVEKTLLKATGGSGAVTATLTDDDRKPVAGQAVTFTSGAKKVTARTAANGVVKASGFPAGSTVTVTYAGVTGQYAPSKASAKA